MERGGGGSWFASVEVNKGRLVRVEVQPSWGRGGGGGGFGSLRGSTKLLFAVFGWLLLLLVGCRQTMQRPSAETKIFDFISFFTTRSY